MTRRLLVKDRPATYDTLQAMIVASSEAVRPPERLTVSEAAVRYVRIKEKNYSGAWSAGKTPYAMTPQDVLTSLDFTGMVFAGPARTGKSQMCPNWIAHTSICDPVDMMIVHMTQATAREWSLSDLAKLFRNSPDVRSRLSPGRQNDNVHDKAFLSGMRVTITWPTITNLSGKTIPRIWLMDYDRMPLNVDGEGDPWTLGRKRTQTFKRHGMTVAESSPGHAVEDPKWMAAAPHEAPPAKGILSLYNMGDRRRWMWNCPSCAGKFEGDYSLFHIPPGDDPMERAEAVTMICPHNGCVLTPDMQHDLNLGGRWIREGETWNEDGSVTGKPRRSDIASFWLKGPAAAFTTWPELVLKMLNAEAEYERTGDEEKLKSVTNTDLGLPYTPKALEAGRLPEELKKRAQDWGGSAEEPCVPAEAAGGFLVATVDVQAGGRPSFVVHVFLISDGGDVWHVAMFKIRKSLRHDADGDHHLIDPASHPEDWDLLISEVLERTYPIGDGSGRRMRVKIVGCDSGGAAGVTANAYDFYRRLRAAGQHQRFHLLKGSPSRSETAPLRVTYPDAQQKDKLATARGDVPVWLVNSNIVKDQATNMLGRTEAGGAVRFPIWAEQWLYSQLTTEIKTPKGWLNVSRKRNEAFDLLAYAIALQRHPDLRTHIVGFWENPPPWAGPWDANDLVFLPNADGTWEQPVTQPKRSLADLAGSMG